MAAINANLLLHCGDSGNDDGRIVYKGKPVALALTDEELIIFGAKGRVITEKINFDVIIGCKLVAASDDVPVSKKVHKLFVYLYEIPKFRLSSTDKTRVLRTICFYMALDYSQCRNWADWISSASNEAGV